MKLIDILITHKDRASSLKRIVDVLSSCPMCEKFNIIVMDDVSQHSFFPKGPTYYIERSGSSAKAKHAVIKKSKADYFILVDSDDIPHTSFCSTIVDHHKQQPLLSFLYQDEQGDIPPKFKLPLIPRNILGLGLLRYPAIICRDAYDKVGGIKQDLPFCADVELYGRLFLEFADQCEKVEKIILTKVRSPDSITVLHSRAQNNRFKRIRNEQLIKGGFYEF